MESKYTTEEWELITSLPQMVGAAMAGAGRSGLFGTTSEVFASVRAVMGAKDKYGDNAFISSMLPDLSDRKKAMHDAKESRERILDRIKAQGVDSHEALSELILNDCHKAMWAIKQKENEADVVAYRTWLLDTAMTVANAAKEGDFLGFGGQRFSEKERELYAKLEEVIS